jgi:hypothetical protein
VTKKFTARMDVDLMPGAGYGTAQIWNEELAPHKGEQVVTVVEAVDVPASSPALSSRRGNDRLLVAPSGRKADHPSA